MPVILWVGFFVLGWFSLVIWGITLEKQLEKWWAFVCCQSFDYSDNSSEGTREVIQLMALSYPVFGLLLAYPLHEPEPSFSVAAIYVIATLIPAVGLCRMIWGYSSMKATSPPLNATYRLIHDYSRTTVKLAAFGFISVVLISFGGALAYWFQMLPTQTPPVELKPISVWLETVKPGEAVEEREIREGDEVVGASYEVSRESFPHILQIKIRDLDHLPPGWSPTDTVGYVWSEGKWKEIKPDQTDSPIGAMEAREYVIYWTGLKTGAKYRLDVLFHNRKHESNGKDVRGLIESRKSVAALAYFTG